VHAIAAKRLPRKKLIIAFSYCYILSFLIFIYSIRYKGKHPFYRILPVRSFKRCDRQFNQNIVPSFFMLYYGRLTERVPFIDERGFQFPFLSRLCPYWRFYEGTIYPELTLPVVPGTCCGRVTGVRARKIIKPNPKRFRSRFITPYFCSGIPGCIRL